MMTAAIAVGAIASTVGLVSTPAQADPDYPSWNDVKNAKKSEAAKQAEIDNIIELVGALQRSVDAASRESKIKAEAYLLTKDALDRAVTASESLQKQADAAEEKAQTSRMRAGLLSAHLAKAGGQNLSMSLLLTGGEASESDSLLYQLGTMNQLSAQSATIYAEATRDMNSANSLGEQATIAAAQRATLADEAQSRYDEADAARRVAQNALDVQLEKTTVLIDQLAMLKDSTAAVEREWLDGEARRKAQEAIPEEDPAPLPPPTSLPTLAPPATGPTNAPTNAPTSAPTSAPTPQPTTPPTSRPTPTPTATPTSRPTPTPTRTPTPTPTPTKSPTPPPSTTPVNPPKASMVEAAIGFASQQRGKPYYSPAAGPNSWDCSGLTMRAYEAAGTYIGPHSATAQYLTMRSQGKTLPFSQRQRGDLIWWSSNGQVSGIYHVAIYIGGGMMIEAADWGKPVREYYIHTMGDVLGEVGRPAS